MKLPSPKCNKIRGKMKWRSLIIAMAFHTLVSGNADDKKNLNPGGRKFVFLIDFPELFSFFLVSFASFVFLFFLLVCLFFEIKNWCTFEYAGRWVIKKFHPTDFRKQDCFFWSNHVMICAIWYHLYNSINVNNTHGGVFLLKSNTPLWVFFTYFKLYIWYQIAKAFHIIFQSSKAQHPSMEIFNFGLFCVALL